MPRKRKLLFVFLTLFLTSLTAVVSSELIARQITASKKLNPTKYFSSNINAHSDPITCNPFLKYSVSPNLGHVFNQKAKKECLFGDDTKINSIGIDQTYEYPKEKSSEFYTILVLGGSVAHQLSRHNFYPDHSVLEEVLNKYYQSPTGKPFKIFAGALGGWKQPTQYNMLALFGDLFHAVISVEGYNELTMDFHKNAIDTADRASLHFAMGPKSSFEEFLISIHKTIVGNRENWIIRNSHFLFLVSNSIISDALTNVENDKRFNTHSLETFYQNLSQLEFSKRNMRKYEFYLKSMSAGANSLGLNYAYFLQPIRWIDKNLTDKEISYTRFIHTESYKQLQEVFKKLRKSGLNTIDTTDLLKNETGEYYIDHIHFDIDINNREESGYYLLSKRIGKELSKLWGLTPR